MASTHIEFWESLACRARRPENESIFHTWHNAASHGSIRTQGGKAKNGCIPEATQLAGGAHSLPVVISSERRWRQLVRILSWSCWCTASVWCELCPTFLCCFFFSGNEWTHVFVFVMRAPTLLEARIQKSVDFGTGCFAQWVGFPFPQRFRLAATIIAV